MCKHVNKTHSGRAVTPSKTSKGWFRGAVYYGGDINDNSKRLPNANVQVNGGESTTAGADGLWGFELKAGNYTVTITHVGYKIVSSTREVKANETVRGSISLEPESAPPPQPKPKPARKPSPEPQPIVEPMPKAATPNVAHEAPRSSGM